METKTTRRGWIETLITVVACMLPPVAIVGTGIWRSLKTGKLKDDIDELKQQLRSKDLEIEQLKELLQLTRATSEVQRKWISYLQYSRYAYEDTSDQDLYGQGCHGADQSFPGHPG